MSDQLAGGRRLWILSVVDDFNRECVGQIMDDSISEQHLARFVEQLSAQRQRPKTIVCDNGPEPTCKEMFFWSRSSGMQVHFIQPGKPTQNAFVENFNGTFRDAFLNGYWFRSQDEARDIVEAERIRHDKERPQSSPGLGPPRFYAERAALQNLFSDLEIGPVPRVRSIQRIIDPSLKQFSYYLQQQWFMR